MTKRMLIDATHAEETRVVVLDGTRLEDFDVETSAKRQLKGNIYLAKVVRVEPSLQAAFVEYGGNRHGFLAFGEIHPDYYQIPVADRQRLIEQEAEEARREEEEEDRAAAGDETEPVTESEPPEAAVNEISEPEFGAPADLAEVSVEFPAAQPADIAGEAVAAPVEAWGLLSEASWTEAEATPPLGAIDTTFEAVERPADAVAEDDDEAVFAPDPVPEHPPPETVGGDGDSAEESRERRIPSRYLRNYKIQEVIKRRQILLVQVVKEERGTKGAALTTYLSLAGRFSVLMPNSPRGGGISRKITSASDRRRLKEIMAELEIPKGMGLIVRTAGANRPKPEIRRDCEYLLRLWDDIREHTLKSVAPALIYEEASLIKRSIRDVYSRDIEEIQVDGEEGWRAAHEFMRMLMPSHAKKVQLWKNGGMPLFAKNQVEAQLDSMLLPTVQLRSGGYLVINQAEALVAIDVNSGRSTRERGIEETALRTNMEAADEVARQLRLRDLAGLIVIDFIDMEAKKHNGMVERRLQEALKSDRARIQVGHISHFGLMEMSRQRLRPSLAETSFIACPHCGGMGHVRSTESAAIHVLRGIEEEGAKRRAAEIVVYAAPPVALYILNHKRERLGEIEQRYGMRVVCLGDDGQMTSQFRIERLRARVEAETPVTITQDIALPPAEVAAEEELAAVEDEEVEAEAVGEPDPGDAEDDAAGAVAGETAEEAERRHHKRRRRRRGGRREETPQAPAAEEVVAPVIDQAEPVEAHVEGVPEPAETAEDEHRARRRGRRGGRRRRPDGNGEMPAHAEPGADQPDLPPVYTGPTPANPFGGQTFDIFDVMDQAEAAAPVRVAVAAVPEPEPVASIIPDDPDPVPAEAMRETLEPGPAVVPNEPEPVQSEAPLSEPEPVPAAVSVEPERVPAVEPVEPEPVQSEAPLSEPEPVPAAVSVEPERVPAVVSVEPEPEPAVVPVEHEPVQIETQFSEPEPEHSAPEPELESVVAANDVAAGPAIKPIIIGGEQEVVLEKKRGWWRR